MFVRVLPVPLLLVAACDSEVDFPGVTAVGNPGDAVVQARSGGGVTLLSGSAQLDALDVTRCPPEPVEVVTVDADIDLLGSMPFPAPPGVWCSAELTFGSALVLTGIEGAGEPGKGTFELVLDVPMVTVPLDRGHWVFEGDRLVFELGSGDWLSRMADVLEDGDHLVVDSAHPLHDLLAAAVADGSALYDDADQDGVLEPDERADPLGAGEQWEEDEDDDR